MEQVEVTKGTSNKPSASIRTSVDQQHTGCLAMEQRKLWKTWRGMVKEEKHHQPKMKKSFYEHSAPSKPSIQLCCVLKKFSYF